MKAVPPGHRGRNGGLVASRWREGKTIVIRRLALAFGRYNRRRKARFALKVAERFAVRSVLLVGVAEEPSPINDLIERCLAEAVPFTVASGIVPYVQGWDHYVVANGLALPFADDTFDLAYANAVVEHVGDERDQRLFIEELARVSSIYIATTPNRWFPVEAHHHTLLTHWSPRWAPRGSVSRLLGKRAFRSLLPFGKVLGWPVLSPTLTAIGIRAPKGSGRSRVSGSGA
jgi:hypothetical protein